jgi:hypothetical protein
MPKTPNLFPVCDSRLEVLMLSYFQAAILGFLQGITELFPISSLGHGCKLRGNRFVLVGEISDQIFQNENTHPIRLILSTLRRSKHVASAQIDSCSISLNHLCARQLDPRLPRSCRSSRYPALHGFDPITTADFELSAKFKHYVRIFTYCHLRRGRQTAVRRSEISGRRDRHLHRQLNS